MDKVIVRPETGKFHKAMVTAFCQAVPDARRKGFFPALLAIEDLEYLRWLKEQNDLGPLKVVPDAYLIDHDECTVTCIEIVDNCDINPPKFARLVDLAFVLDENYWSLDLVRFDAHGYSEYNILQAWAASRLNGDRWQQYHKTGRFNLSSLFATPAFGKTIKAVLGEVGFGINYALTELGVDVRGYLSNTPHAPEKE